MTRLILTYETVYQVLAADKCLKTIANCRTIPTPSGLSSSICGIAIEILEREKKDLALSALESAQLFPDGVHLLS